MPRYLGIDHGLKRIGLSLSDVDGTIASPLRLIEGIRATAAQVEAVIKAGEEFDVEAFVLGLPLNMDGTVGKQAKIAQQFGRELGARSGMAVYEWDERLSSRGADEYLAAAELTLKKRKARRDALAAQIVLQSFLDARRQDQ